MAFRRWRANFVPLVETDKGGPLCRKLFKELVIGCSKPPCSPPTLHAQFRSQVAVSITGHDEVAKNLCDLFGTVTHPERVLGIDAVRHVEECNGVWRGAFAGFVNASGNADLQLSG